MVRHATNETVGDYCRAVPLALPNGKQPIIEKPVVERTDANRIRINIDDAVLVKNFVTHQVIDDFPLAPGAKHLNLAVALPFQHTEFEVAPHPDVPIQVPVFPRLNTMVGTLGLITNPNDVQLLRDAIRLR